MKTTAQKSKELLQYGVIKFYKNETTKEIIPLKCYNNENFNHREYRHLGLVYVNNLTKTVGYSTTTSAPKIEFSKQITKVSYENLPGNGKIKYITPFTNMSIQDWDKYFTVEENVEAVMEAGIYSSYSDKQLFLEDLFKSFLASVHSKNLYLFEYCRFLNKNLTAVKQNNDFFCTDKTAIKNFDGLVLQDIKNIDTNKLENMEKSIILLKTKLEQISSSNESITNYMIEISKNQWGEEGVNALLFETFNK